MDKLKVGMYVRTKHGIGKIDATVPFMDKYFQFHLDSDKGRIHNVTSNTYWNSPEDIIGEPSYEVIDLIEEGDYVNGYKVDFVQDGYVVFNHNHPRQMNIYPKDIRTIVTKEQFKSMEYLVEKNL